jgi:hypothetical protein
VGVGRGPPGPLISTSMRPWWTPTPTTRARRRPTSTGSGCTRCAAAWTAATGPGRRSVGAGGPATPGPTPPPTMSRCSRWRCLPGRRRRGHDRSWCGPTPPARPTPSSRSCTGGAVVLDRVSDRRCGAGRDPGRAPGRLAARPRPARPPAPGRLGRRAYGPGPVGLAAGDAGDLPPRAAHPGARHKMTVTDPTGPLPGAITNQPDPTSSGWRPATAPAGVEDRLGGAKATGLRHLPRHGFAANDAWLTWS